MPCAACFFDFPFQPSNGLLHNTIVLLCICSASAGIDVIYLFIYLSAQCRQRTQQAMQNSVLLHTLLAGQHAPDGTLYR